MTWKTFLKAVFSLTLAAVLVLGISAVTAETAGAAIGPKPMPTPPPGSPCDTTTACTGSNESLHTTGCTIVLRHDCIGYGCAVYVNDFTGEFCYDPDSCFAWQ